MKLWLYERIPREPSVKDLTWLRKIKGEDDMRKKLERFYSDDKDRMDKEWKNEDKKGKK